MQRITFYTVLLIYIFSQGIHKSNAQTDDLSGLRFKDDRIRNIWLSSVAICNFVLDASNNRIPGLFTTGSGTLIHPDGWVLTAEHVIRNSTIVNSKNKKYVLYQLGHTKYFYQYADICISDSTHDIALIQFKIPDEHKSLLRYAKIINEEYLRIGEYFNYVRCNVYDDGLFDDFGNAILRPECEKQVKRGIVSGFLNRPSDDKNNFEWTFLIDADMVEGDSGAGIFLEGYDSMIGVIRSIVRKQIGHNTTISIEKIAVTFPPIRDLIHKAGIKPEEVFYIPPKTQ